MRIFCLGISFLFALSTYAADKPRVPSNLTNEDLNCDSPTTATLQALVFSLSKQQTIKDRRYEDMQNSLNKASDCETVNQIMLTAIRDCTVKKEGKLPNCKK